MSVRNMQQLNSIFALTLLCIFTIAHAHPIYEEPGRQSVSSLLYTDPLQSDASVELPVLHNNNFDTIMPDYFDHNSAASMQYQNFEKFYDTQMVGNNEEYKMDESQFLHGTPVRAPQPLSDEERRARKVLEPVDVKHEQKKLLKLKKGSTKPRSDASQWDQFDYDMYSVNPGNDKKYYEG